MVEWDYGNFIPCKDGWIPYDGTGQPIGNEVKCQIRMKDDSENHSMDRADSWEWNWEGDDWDIVAYRLEKGVTK